MFRLYLRSSVTAKCQFPASSLPCTPALSRMGLTLFAATLALTQLLLLAAIIGQAILASRRQVRRGAGRGEGVSLPP